MRPLRAYATERVPLSSCSSLSQAINAYGRRKERTLRVVFRADRAVETKQGASENMFHYPLLTKEPSFVRQRPPIDFASRQGWIQSRQSGTEAEYLRRRPQVRFVRGEKVHADPRTAAQINQIVRLIPDFSFWTPPFFPSRFLVRKDTGCDGRLRRTR